MGVDAGDIRVGVEEGDGESRVCKDGDGVAGEEGGVLSGSLGFLSKKFFVSERFKMKCKLT